jgi:hypothetical protein
MLSQSSLANGPTPVVSSREEIRARDLFHLDSIPQVPQCFAITMSIYYFPVAKELKKKNALCVPNTASTLPTDYWNVLLTHSSARTLCIMISTSVRITEEALKGTCI